MFKGSDNRLNDCISTNLETGIFLDNFKVAKVCAIYKSGLKTDLGN